MIENKVDLTKHRAIKIDAAKLYVKKQLNTKQRKGSYVHYLETSAKTGENVIKAFKKLSGAIYQINKDGIV